jgi:hypothetical protein
VILHLLPFRNAPFHSLSKSSSSISYQKMQSPYRRVVLSNYLKIMSPVEKREDLVIPSGPRAPQVRMTLCSLPRVKLLHRFTCPCPSLSDNINKRAFSLVHLVFPLRHALPLTPLPHAAQGRSPPREHMHAHRRKTSLGAPSAARSLTGWQPCPAWGREAVVRTRRGFGRPPPRTPHSPESPMAACLSRHAAVQPPDTC